MSTTLTLTSAQPSASDAPAAPPRHVGTVKWFNDAKGFGFILDAEGNDVFVHYAVIEAPGFRTLEEGEPVRYEVERGPKGVRATRVVRDDSHHASLTTRRNP